MSCSFAESQPEHLQLRGGREPESPDMLTSVEIAQKDHQGDTFSATQVNTQTPLEVPESPDLSTPALDYHIQENGRAPKVIYVNKVAYTRVGTLGRGGSSK